MIDQQQILYGGDYNPEQWPADLWREDVRLMREAGVNLVTLGVFAWARLEPRPGEYDWAWLDEVIALLHENKIRIDLATATASPPPWLGRLHPESLPVNREGTRLWYGSRQHYCPSSPAYREAIQRLVTQLARRYGEHPALLLWHINNEYGCHVAECFCDESARAFREWLRRRYGTLEALNAAWGTAFWSQGYGDWAEILPPRAAPTSINPTQQLDWQRFSSDALLECFAIERSILKTITPQIPVTTNFMGFFKCLDHWTWAAQQDLIALDIYPDPATPDAHHYGAIAYDLTRSLGGGAPWLLMEQVTSQVQWRSHNRLKRPGQMRLWSYQALARGANGILFFQWRASKAGAEKFHGALLPHVGTENSRIWREVTALGRELQQLTPILNSRVQASVAIVLDWESWWALEGEGKPSADLRMVDQIWRSYEQLWPRNIAVDFVPPDANLERYRLVCIPNLYLVRDDAAERIEHYVAAGGTLLLSFFSGIVDENDHVRLGGYPAPFRRLLGLRVEEFEPYTPQQRNRLLLADGTSCDCRLWSDLIDLEGAQPLAHYADDWYAGRPAITRRQHGRGTAYYLGTQPDQSGMSWLFDRVLDTAGVTPTLATPAGVEAVRRGDGERSFLFLLNHSDKEQTVALDRPGRDLHSQRLHSRTISLAPLDVAVLAEEHGGSVSAAEDQEASG
jgi:beta-galactosidase